jgi:hypothetical protein
MPPYLAGREAERKEFERLLGQTTILENLVLTGLRGAGKTVLLDTFKGLALQRRWMWVGADVSESASVTEDALATRIIVDLSVVGATLAIEEQKAPGFSSETTATSFDYATLSSIYTDTPGLVADRLKAVLETVAAAASKQGKRGIVFAYDEAQNLADQDAEGEFPLSVMLDVFQSIQRKGIPFMLLLTGLPALFPKLVEARTFARRMFHVVTLKQLDPEDTRDAITKPIAHADCPVSFAEESVDQVANESGGHPYFIQFICREVYDVFIQSGGGHGSVVRVPMEGITKKLDSDFFAGRWAQATGRQQQLLWCVAQLDTPEGTFSVQELVEMTNARLAKPFSSSHANQMLAALSKSGLVYKNGWGRYSLAVPLFDRFILRQAESIEPARLG